MGKITKEEFNGVDWIPYTYFTCDICGADCNQDAPNPRYWAFEYLEDKTYYCFDCREKLFRGTIEKAK